MKAPNILLLAAVSLATASPIERRQSGNALMNLVNSLPPSYIINPSNAEETNSQLRQTATRKLVRYGPFKVPPNTDEAKTPTEGHAHGGTGTPAMGADAFPLEIFTGQKPMDPNGFSTIRILADGAMCTNCTVLAGKMDVVFENGTRADIRSGVYLHHVVTIDLTKQKKTFVSECPGAPAVPPGQIAPGGLPIFLGGAVDVFTQWYTTPDGKFDSGYHIQNNKFMMQIEMVNYHKAEQTLYVLVDLEYEHGQIGSEISQARLAATGCNSSSAWRPPKDTAGTVEADGYKVTTKGHIIAARGHLHDGGTSVSLSVNGKHYCTSKAIYGGAGGKLNLNGKRWETISKMTECNNPMPVNAGDLIKIEGAYDTKNHPLRESHGEEQEVMALMYATFAPENDPNVSAFTA